ncbi:ferredoxin--NADP reductase [Rhodococcus triatomae]|uniref:3-ketosteroid 9alpha-monooxygenase subunit B n=1 Tax=Rhodococcus triatomae TaxID=300028 RepID=A0A1G7ZTP7_9NOCA|nr:ferredoxin--NADP reductase [Rhodococcus triatomae]QNG17950.1 ferredoxin--NADP reductase [Rhodococcus triatomae]QNG22382.1 ferredoxin--NADP reductase [Rhodococcus triatomae]SDH12102.1 3-ketosteroid 9alpha-monooxygenase subunit B [Rhodococcus triatomae]
MTTVETPKSSRSVLVTVADVVRETSDSVSLVFDIAEEHRDRFDYAPGQFLTVRIPSERTGWVARCYSLASSPFTGERPKVTVKRTVDGYGSNWLCDNISAGDALEVLPPSGVFTPPDLNENLLLFAAGSGITPVMSILGSALAVGSAKVVLVYANRDESSVIFAEELRALAAAHPERLTVVHWLESVQGLPTSAQLAATARAFADHRAFTCGPGPYMDAVREACSALGMPRDRVHAEVFTSLTGDPFADLPTPELDDADTADAASATVVLDGREHELAWPRKSTLVEVMLSKGLDVPYSCREGECGSCACTVTSGEVAMDAVGMLEPEDIAAGYVLGCQARPISDRVQIEF